ncbi:MAG: YihY/virulence factor BrkB family protein [Candidatus Eisenbacteria sp.]|nr:YihY/virulence factor BrkB family protein [Candidatus Eisenbacteria bacterium]
MNERIERLKALFHRLQQFLSERLWEEDLKARRGFRGLLFRELRILVVVGQGVYRGQIPLRASAMTLATLLALIPSIVLVFTLIGAFGGFEGIDAHLQRFILQNLIAGVQDQVSAFLKTFLAGVHSGAFQGISLFFLLGAVFGLLRTVEGAFNHIWGIKRMRSVPHQLTTYTTIAALSPFLVGFSLMATASMQNAPVFLRLQSWAPVGGLFHFIFGLLPILVTVLALTFLYVVLPNTKVSIFSAFPSALLAGAIWEISKWGYGSYLSSRAMYSSLYGSLTAIPILILWIQLSWIIVLGGALLTFAREAADSFLLEEGALTASFHDRLRAALRCMISICRAHSRGETAPNVSELSVDVHIPVRLVRSAVGDLLSGGLLHEVVRRQAMGEGGLVPAKDVQNLSVHDVVACLQSAGTSSPPSTGENEAREVERILLEIDSNLENLGRPMTFNRILEGLENSSLPSPAIPAPVQLLKRT